MDVQIKKPFLLHEKGFLRRLKEGTFGMQI
jgi:hypothetical protein